jgi:hypothetical protein
LLDKSRPIISGLVPTIDLPDDELAAAFDAVAATLPVGSAAFEPNDGQLPTL